MASGEGWDAYVATVRKTRSRAGQPLARWSAAHLLTALDLAVRGRGWPATSAADALLHVAGDPATRSPARLAEAGPWWDQPQDVHPATPVYAVGTEALERELDAVDGMRTRLQAQARADLIGRGHTLTRAAVLARAVELLHQECGPTIETEGSSDRG